MSMDSRSSSALFKRAEQLKRWEESETNREPEVHPNGKTRKIKFPAGCVFLAACAAGDKDEVLKLLKKGADIDTTNVDGLSALHQACIDDNLDMVEFLVEHGADLNKGDNEGWTPLHATASCGFMSIAKYLIENGGNVAAVNNDGELPVDIAESNEMEDMLQQQIDDKGIDAEDARNEEERMMLADAKNWLSAGVYQDKLHPKTGATALHVAAAKGYIKVLDILLKAQANVDAQDFDGWTPLHAAAHWGQREACEILVEHMCDMEMKNYVGQTPFDVAETEIVRVLEDLRKKQTSRDKLINKTQNNNKIKSPVDKNPVITDSLPIKSEKGENEDMRPKVPEVPKVELEIQPAVPSEDERENRVVEKKNRANRDESERITKIVETNKTVPSPVPTLPPAKPLVENDDSVPSWRRPAAGSFRSRGADSVKPNLTLQIGVKEQPVVNKPPTAANPPNRTETPQEVVLRRTQSFEADEKFYPRYLELRAKINAGNSCPTLHPPPTRSASLKEKHFLRRSQVKEDSRVTSPVSTASTTITSVAPTSPTSPSVQQPNPVRSSVPSTPSTPTTPGGSKLSPGNIFKNFFKSFVPPVRDEESETQRKAHAKRVRETRRSTQGVTLEEIKSAEQLVKKKQQQQLQQATQQLNSTDQPGGDGGVGAEDVIVNVHSNLVERSEPLRSPTQTEQSLLPNQDRRPSWRLRVDNGSKFMLEDVRSSNETTPRTGESDTGFIRRAAIATPVTDTGEATVTLPLRRNRPDDKEQDKENDARTAQATQAVIQRRRRPKRRSTGVVNVDMEEIDPERNTEPLSGIGGEMRRPEESSTTCNSVESGTEKSGRTSRVDSAVSSSEDSKETTPTTENGEIDYKKLYEESQLENERLREKLQHSEQDLALARAQAEKNALLHKNSLSEMEKRERRTLERKLSEMEEELKQLQKLKADNERLRADNLSLTRVVSKLSATFSRR